MKTREQQKLETLRFIVQYNDIFRLTPTVRETMRYVEIRSFETIHSLLTELRDEGMLHQKIPGRNQPYLPTMKGKAFIDKTQMIVEREVVRLSVSNVRASGGRKEWIELIQHASTGVPLFDSDDEIIEVPYRMLPVKPNEINRLIALRVRGPSMQDALIGDGDVIIARLVQPGYRPRQGEVVIAALIDKDEMTIKHYYEFENSIELRPANDHFKPIKIAKNKVRVIATMVMRSYVYETKKGESSLRNRYLAFNQLFRDIYDQEMKLSDILKKLGATDAEIDAWRSDRAWMDSFLRVLGPSFLAMLKQKVLGSNALALDYYYGLTRPELDSDEAIARVVRTNVLEIQTSRLAYLKYLRTTEGRSALEALVFEAAGKVTSQHKNPPPLVEF